MQSLYNKTFYFLDNAKPIHLGIYFSLFLHLLILLFAIGLPDFFQPKKILVPQIVPIEILNISDITSLAPKKENIDFDNKQNKKTKQKKFNASENTEIQNLNIQQKTKKNIIKNEKISDNTFVAQKDDLKNITLKEKKINKLNNDKKVILDNAETLKVNKIKPKLKPKSIEKKETITDVKIEKNIKPLINKNDEKKILDKPKPIEKTDVKIEQNIKPLINKNDEKQISDKPKPIEKPEPDLNLATMLKDLRNEDITNVSNNNDEEENKLVENEKDLEEVNQEVSISELDLVLQQLRSCFNPRAGTQIVGDEMVKISAKIDRQAKVRKDTVQIIATNISKSNPYYEAITESAVATLYNPLCSKLKLPLDKYESWKDLKITIDYSWIKN